MTFGTRARIRLGAIQHNFQAMKSLVPGARTMAVVKANAYGLGQGVVVVKSTTATETGSAGWPSDTAMRWWSWPSTTRRRLPGALSRSAS